MRQQFHSLDQILFAQELITANPLNLSIKIVNKNMGLGVGVGPTDLLAPRQNARRKYRRHSPRCISVIPTWPIDQNHVPRHVVQVVRHVVDPQRTFREQEILHRSAVVFDSRFRDRDEFAHVGDFGCVRHVVGFDSRVRLLEFRDQELVLV